MKITRTDHWSRDPKVEALTLLDQLDETADLNHVFSATRSNRPSWGVPGEEWVHAMVRISEEVGEEMGLYGCKKNLRYKSKVLITPVSDRIYGDRDCYRVQLWTERTGHRSIVLAREVVADMLDNMIVNLYRAADAHQKYRLFRASRDETYAEALKL